mgnify:CR=1 FL=1
MILVWTIINYYSWSLTFVTNRLLIVVIRSSLLAVYLGCQQLLARFSFIRKHLLVMTNLWPSIRTHLLSLLTKFNQCVSLYFLKDLFFDSLWRGRCRALQKCLLLLSCLRHCYSGCSRPWFRRAFILLIDILACHRCRLTKTKVDLVELFEFWLRGTDRWWFSCAAWCSIQK